MIVKLVLIVLLIIAAGRFAALLLSGPYALTFWGGTVALGILVPLALNWYARRPGMARGNRVMVVAVLALFGGALLRISLVQAGQV
jgi:formate-dependent nitrite reductase membrane component NrfD